MRRALPSTRALVVVGSIVALAAGLLRCSSEAPVEASADIGATGGTVSTDGAELVLPPGALHAATHIAIATSQTGGPSPKFTFSPTSLALDAKATVRVRVDVPVQSPVLMWDEGAGAVPLTTTFANGWVSADVSHLGVAYVLGGSSDAGLDANDESNGPSDASACNVPPIAVNVGDVVYPQPADFVSSDPFTNVYETPFTVSQNVMVAAHENHNLLGGNQRFGFYSGCGAGKVQLVDVGVSHVAAVVLTPGLYTYRFVEDLGFPYPRAMTVETVPPAATNTSCQTADDIFLNPTVYPRALDTSTRYFKYTEPQFSQTLQIFLTSPDTAGGTYTLSVRSDCTKPATEVAQLTTYLWANGKVGVALPHTPGTFWVVVTGAEVGDRYTATISQ